MGVRVMNVLYVLCFLVNLYTCLSIAYDWSVGNPATWIVYLGAVAAFGEVAVHFAYLLYAGVRSL